MNLRTLTVALLGVVGAAAAILSFGTLYGLAVSAGYGRNVAWLLPITIDAGAAAALLAWRTGHSPAGAAARVCLGLMVGSVALNAVEHLVVTGALPGGWWLTLLVSAVPPAVLGLVVHALAKPTEPTTRTTVGTTWTRVDDAGPDLRERPAKSITERPRDATGKFVATDRERLDQIATLAATNGHVPDGGAS